MSSNIPINQQRAINEQIIGELAEARNKLSSKQQATSIAEQQFLEASSQEDKADKLVALKSKQLDLAIKHLQKLIEDKAKTTYDPRQNKRWQGKHWLIPFLIVISYVLITQYLKPGSQEKVLANTTKPVPVQVEEEPVPTSVEFIEAAQVVASTESLDDKLVKLSGYLTSNKISSPIPAEVFIDTERRMNCDADFLVAITGADSSYGKSLATSYNPGNVGNTSSGGRKGFSSWQEGVDAICQTLNNQYLSGYDRIGELSNGGRTQLGLPACGSAKCYAHSTGPWNINVTSIMSELKGETVTASYIFRRTE